MTPIRHRLRALVVAAMVALAGLSARAEPPMTVFIVRHAEKDGAGSDPSLSAAGRRRAETLAAMLADAGITAIFSSEFKRTQETALPLAKALGLTVTVVPGKDVDALVTKVRELPSEGRALIVGHSNTVPELVRRLTEVKVAELADADYDRLFIGTVPKEGQGQALCLHYGAPGGGAP